jgi:DNA invertase Pin-like site-specific DNA recombinase
MFMTPEQSRELEEVLRSQQWQPQADSRKIGYARVSTGEQNLDMQLAELAKHGVMPDDMFSEHMSATAKKRPALANALRQCRTGDVFVVWRLGRVARSLKQLLDIMQDLTDRGIGFVSLTERVDTTTAIGRLYVQLAGAFAEFERQLIVERTRAGVARAKERGVKFGRELVIDLEYADYLVRTGRTVAEVADLCGVSKQTVRNHYDQRERARLAKLGPTKAQREKYN